MDMRDKLLQKLFFWIQAAQDRLQMKAESFHGGISNGKFHMWAAINLFQTDETAQTRVIQKAFEAVSEILFQVKTTVRLIITMTKNSS